MLHRESILPLAVGLCVSILAHLAVVPVAGRIMQANADTGPKLVTVELDTPVVATAGEEISVQFSVKNEGDRPTADGWRSSLYLSADQMIDSRDELLDEQQHGGSVEPEATVSGAATAALPERSAGKMYLILKVAADHESPSFAPANDQTIAQAIFILTPPRPDLIVTKATTPDRIEVGQPVTVSWEVINQGDKPAASADWIDRISLSRDEWPSADDRMLAEQPRSQTLAPGERIQSDTVTFGPPADFTGRVYLLIHTDGDNAIEEYPNEQNNVFALPYLIPDPDQKQTQPPPKPVVKERKEIQPPEEPDEIKLGKQDAENIPKVAWIPYEDYEKLVATKMRTLQPAVQTKAVPTPDAPARTDASNPRSAIAAASPPPGVPTPMIDQTAKRPTPVETTPNPLARSVERPEASSKVKEQETPKQQQPAEAAIEQPVPPTRQDRAIGPNDPTVAPATQNESRTDLPDPTGAATHQDETGLPEPARIRVEPNAPMLARNPAEIDPVARTRSESADEKPAVPNDQREARSPKPNKNVKPRQQDPARAVRTDPDGKPISQPEVVTDKSDPAGKPATTPATRGDKNEDRNDPDAAKPKPVEQALPPRSGQPTKPSTSSQGAPAEDDPKPTSAAKADRESPPTSVETPIDARRVGSVEVGKGLEVKTVAPRFSIVSRLSSAPKDIKTVITFTKKGAVRHVEIVSSSGYEDIDAAVESAIYKWTAKGKELEEAEGDLKLKMTIQF